MFLSPLCKPETLRTPHGLKVLASGDMRFIGFWGFGFSLTVVSWALHVVPNLPLQGSDVRALNVSRVHKGDITGTLLRAHAKGPCNCPKTP